MSKLLRNGRLPSIREDVVKFTSSISNDLRLLKKVVQINQAHVIMMMEEKIVNYENGAEIVKALTQIKTVKLRSDIEDIHMYVEEEVTKITGPDIGGNLHIAKSRNDQVSTALRMELRDCITDLTDNIIRLQETMISRATRFVKTIVPGYTHLQLAQPVTFAHYLISYFDALQRDVNRIKELYYRVNKCPMGACALATTSFPINRKRVAELLGFDGVLENSIDAINDRDFMLETLSKLSLLAVHLSRIAEDIIIWSSQEFTLVELPNNFTSTSSIMPQKKNPELLEIVRARMSCVIGNLMTGLIIMKGLPSGYNLDFQEITPEVWKSLKNIVESLNMLSELFSQINVSKKSFDKESYGFTASTELANLLTRKYQVPFRTAHKIVGISIKELIDSGSSASDITVNLLKKIAKNNFGLILELNEKETRSSMDPMNFIKAHNVMGGPSPMEGKRMIKVRKQLINESRVFSSSIKKKLKETEIQIESIIESYLS